MFRGIICLADIMAQIALGAAFHFVMGHDLSTLTARIGIIVPTALVCLAVWRIVTGSNGWIDGAQQRMEGSTKTVR